MHTRLSELLKTQKRPPLNSLDLPFSPMEAAVLLLLVPDEGADSVVFTKRSENVAHHKGQICFPGGVVDPQDPDLWSTALRETKEEIGVEPGCVSLIGELGQVLTPTGFRITPFVGRVTSPVCWNPSPDEIAEIFTVPLPHLLEPANLKFQERHSFGAHYVDPVFTYKNHEIWGATGRIILDFLEAWKSVSR